MTRLRRWGCLYITRPALTRPALTRRANLWRAYITQRWRAGLTYDAPTARDVVRGAWPSGGGFSAVGASNVSPARKGWAS